MGARGRFIVVLKDQRNGESMDQFEGTYRVCKWGVCPKGEMEREEKSWNEKIQKSLYAYFKHRHVGVGWVLYIHAKGLALSSPFGS